MKLSRSSSLSSTSCCYCTSKQNKCSELSGRGVKYLNRGSRNTLIHGYTDIYIYILLLHFRCWVEPSLCAFSVFFSYYVEGLLVFYWLALFLTNSSSDQTLKPLKGDVNNIYHLVTWHAHPLKSCCRWRWHSSMALRPVCQFPTSQSDNNCWKCRHNSDPFWPHAPTYTGFVHIF